MSELKGSYWDLIINAHDTPAVFVRLSPRLPMNAAQLSALALGLPWQRMGDAGVITIL